MRSIYALYKYFLIFFSYKKNLIFIKICGQTHFYSHPQLSTTIYLCYSQKCRSWTWRGAQENTVILFLRSSILYALHRRHSFYGSSFGSFILYAFSYTSFVYPNSPSLILYAPLSNLFSYPPYPLLLPLLSYTLFLYFYLCSPFPLSFVCYFFPIYFIYTPCLLL